MILNNIACIEGERGNKARQLELNLEAIELLSNTKHWSSVVTILYSFSFVAENDALGYLAQSVWLSLKIMAPLDSTINRIRDLFNQLPQGHQLESLLSVIALYLCESRGNKYPQLQELKNESWEMLRIAAGCQTEKDFNNWWLKQGFDNPEYFTQQTFLRLEEIVGDGWLFDRQKIANTQ
jgi:hypothetical protein